MQVNTSKWIHEWLEQKKWSVNSQLIALLVGGGVQSAWADSPANDAAAHHAGAIGRRMGTGFHLGERGRVSRASAQRNLRNHNGETNCVPSFSCRLYASLIVLTISSIWFVDFFLSNRLLRVPRDTNIYSPGQTRHLSEFSFLPRHSRSVRVWRS